jgi:anthranilate phosphoribosyltransferase
MADVLVEALERVTARNDLDTSMARQVMDSLMEGKASQLQAAALLAALRTKGETVEEITGMVESMRAHALTVDLPVDAVDTCGTGGDRTGTFNISTAAALVAAGAGCPVAKHGNRAASSRCGSADVLEALGVVISLPPAAVRRCVLEAGIGFLFAPAFHPAMRHVGPVRRELGVPTVFNILGPLANPAGVRHQAVGVGNPGVAQLVAQVLRRLGHRRAMVFTGAEGLDELGLNGPSTCLEVSERGVRRLTIDPTRFGLRPAGLQDLAGGEATDNALRITHVLDGEEGSAREVVLLNAGAVLVAAERCDELGDGIALARTSLDVGAARRALDLLVSVSQSAAAPA